jgi:hypothetical protein
MQVKTTLGKVFETWKRNNNGTDEQIIELLRTNPATYRELQAVPIGSQNSPDPYPTKQAIDSIANRRGISAAGLTSIIKSI